MKSFVEALKNAGGMDVDGTFIREFNFDEDEPDYAIDVDIPVEDEIVNYVISLDNINEAVEMKDGSWTVMADMGDWEESVTITLYDLVQIKA